MPVETPEKIADPITSYLEERFHISEFQKVASKKLVPMHKHSIWYYVGGVAAMFLGVQIVTGILLMVYYIPDINSAHASILKINSQVDFGWFVRSIHSWGANLLIAVVLIHFFSTYFMKAYRKPREFTWLTGLALLVICLGFGFTGYLLPWDDVSLFATKIGLDITGKAPIVGEIMANLLRGGDSVSQATISRFFTIHVAVLPGALLTIMGLHLAFVQLHGMSEPKVFKQLPKERRPYEKFFPNFFLKDILVWILALNALFVLVMLFPWGIGPEADAFAPAPIGIKPEWYFLAPFQFLKFIPPMLGPIEGEVFGVMFVGLVGASFALIPFIDNGKSEFISKATTMFGIFVLFSLVVLSIWGALS